MQFVADSWVVCLSFGWFVDGLAGLVDLCGLRVAFSFTANKCMSYR